MILKKILVKDLTPGMYVSMLDRPWLETDFIFQGFQIQKEEEIEGIAKHCKFVYIDLEQSISLEHSSSSPITTGSQPGQSTFENELIVARQAQKNMERTLDQLWGAARAGDSINIKEVQSSVLNLVDSVIRNSDALCLLSNLRDKDKFASSHAINVCIQSIIFGRHLGFNKELMNELGIGALLHDIGETCIPNDLLEKGYLSTEIKKSLIKLHTHKGVEILSNIDGIPSSSIQVARCHHEHFDGSGYPQGIKAGKTPHFARIVALVDAYDSATCPRIGDAASIPDALKSLYELRGIQFEAKLVESFITCFGIYPIGSLAELSSGEVGIIISANPDKRLQPKLILALDSNKTPYYPKRIINLANLEEKSDDGLHVKQVLHPSAYGVDIKGLLLEELPLDEEQPTLA